MAKRSDLYPLNGGDQAIFAKVAKTGDPNWFTKYYLRGESTGTWWRPDARSARWRTGYDRLYAYWKSINKPDEFSVGSNDYHVIMDQVVKKPTFHHHHGFLFQPWQLKVYQAPQRIRMVVGGYGSGKTYSAMAGILVRAATLPGYRALVLAPASPQTREAYRQAINIFQSTLYEERFVLKTITSPFPEIHIGNKYVGSSNMIQFFPVADARGFDKILTLTIDEAMVDQAEQIFNIDEGVRKIGSRMRGDYQGRPRLGRMTWLANSAFNDQLWSWYDRAKDEPNRVLSLSPASSDNVFITDEQITEMERDVGGDEESIRVHMRGGRPLGNGEYFSADTIRKIQSPLLDDLMKEGLEMGLEGIEYDASSRAGITKWALPYREGHNYAVATDPGFDNPPRRNSPVTLVMDITDFPAKPASLAAFYWTFGRNSPDPWMQTHVHAVEKYRAKFMNGIDNTGFQSMYDRLMPIFEDIMTQGVSASGGKKYGYLNMTTVIASRGLYQFPFISSIYEQMARYTLPDDNIAQDIIAALMVMSAILEQQFYAGMAEQKRDPGKQANRHTRPISGRHSRSRVPGRRRR